MWHLLLLTLQATSTTAQIVTAANGIKFNCPNRETIETAYFNYCPASVEVLGELIGSADIAFYNADYTTQSQAFELDCAYGEPVENVSVERSSFLCLRADMLITELCDMQIFSRRRGGYFSS